MPLNIPVKTNGSTVLASEFNALVDTANALQDANAGMSTQLGTLIAKTPSNPSTVDKQIDQLTALNSMIAKLIAAPATEAKQDAVNTLITALKASVDAVNASVATVKTGTDDINLNLLNAVVSAIVDNNSSLSQIYSALNNNGKLNDVVDVLTDVINVNVLNQPTSTATSDATAANQVTTNNLLAKGAQTIVNSIGVNVASDQVVNVKSVPGPSLGSGDYNIHHHKVIAISATTSSTLVRNSAVNVNWVTAYSTVVCFLKLYNGTSAPGVGSDTPTYVFYLPANTPVNLMIKGTRFATGMGYTITGGSADLDTTNITGTVIVNINYI